MNELIQSVDEIQLVAVYLIVELLRAVIPAGRLNISGSRVLLVVMLAAATVVAFDTDGFKNTSMGDAFDSVIILSAATVFGNELLRRLPLIGAQPVKRILQGEGGSSPPSGGG